MPSVAITTAASGDTTLVAAVAGQKYRVRGYVLDALGSVNATLKSGANALTGAIPLIAGTPLVCPLGGNHTDPSFWFETNAGEALILNLSGAVQVSGHLVYDKITG